MASVRTCSSEIRQSSSATVFTMVLKRSSVGAARRAAINRSKAAERSGNDFSTPTPSSVRPVGYPGAVEHLVAPRHHLVVQLVGYAQDMGRDGTREGNGQVVHEVTAAPGIDGVQPATNVRPGPVLGRGRRPRGE